MADDKNLLLEHLRHIRGRVDELSKGFDDVKYRLNSVEQQVAGLRADLAHYSARQDQFERCAQHIEKRLELTDDRQVVIRTQ